MVSNRKIKRLLTGTALIFFLLLLSGLLYLLTQSRRFNRAASVPPTIHWTALPAPVTLKSAWTSFTNTQTVNDALWHDGFIWAATDGGAVVWDATTGQFAKFTVEHGLADNRVNSTAVASDGAIWFGTPGGLSRYDGRTWQTFTQDNGLPANDIHDILATPDGRIWAATAQGIARYDGRSWTTFNRTTSLLQLPADDIRALAGGTIPGTIWAATSTGAAYYDGRRWQDYTQTGSQASNDIRDITQTPDGTVWAASAAGLKRLEGDQWQLFTSADGLSANEIRQLTAQTDNTLWLLYDTPANVLTHFDSTGTIPLVTNIPLETAVTNLAAVPGNELLLGTDSGLLWRDKSGAVRPFNHPDDFPFRAVNALTWAGGAAWIAGSGGSARFDGTTWQLFPPGEHPPAQEITSLTADQTGQLWAAFAQPYQGAAYFRQGSWQPFACPIPGPPSNLVRGAVLDDDGRLWFATKQGIGLTDGKTWQIMTRELPSPNIQTIARTPDGRIWAGSDAGLAVWENKEWRRLNHEDIRELAVGPDGLVWFISETDIRQLAGGTTTTIPAPPVSQVYDFLAEDGGFWLAATEGIFRYTQNDYQTYPGLAGDRPTALLRTKEGTIWAASSQLVENSHPDFGSWQATFTYLNRLQDQMWQPYLLANPTGPVYPTITAILPAPDGRVWLGTLAGISRYDGQNWHAYNQLHGLPDSTILELAWGGETVWAVTPQGLARYLPESDSWQAAAELAAAWRVPGDVHLAAGPDGTLWAAAEGAVRHLVDGRWQPVPEMLPHPQAGIRAVAVAEDGHLWAAAYANSDSIPEAERHFLGEFNGTKWRWRQLVWPSGGGRAAVNWLAFAPEARNDPLTDGRLWLGTSTALWTLDPADDAAQPVRLPAEMQEAAAVLFSQDGQIWTGGRFQPDLISLNSGDRISVPLPQIKNIYALAQAANGDIWVGTNRGAARLTRNGSWDLFYGPDPAAAPLPTTLYGSDSSLWLGTFDGAVWHIVNGRVTEIWPPTRPDQASPVSVLLEDRAGALWKASFGGGAARRDGRTWTIFRAEPDFFQAEVADTAVSLDGTIWLGTDKGLFTIRSENDRLTCRFEPAGKDILAQALAADSQGNIWAVSEGTLWQGDGAGFRRAATLVQPVVTAAPEGAVWFVAGDELVRLENGRRQTISTADLPGTVTAIALGPDGRLWLGTTAGAAVREDGRWRRLTTQDGLADNLVWQVRPAPDGTVWFLTGGGVSRLRP